MNETAYGGLGGEVTDQTLITTGVVTPLWLLRPLPLARINPAAADRPTTHRGKADSLRSCCLSVISRSFETYDPTTLAALPPILAGVVMARVRADRRYPAGGGQADPVSRARPDEATMWAYSVLADPEGGVEKTPSHTLALPTHMTCAQLPQNKVARYEHPFTALPRLFESLNLDTFSLLTTLSLSGINASVDDNSLQNLRWCTHLTVLRMKGCSRVTDDGIRMLSAALVLPTEFEEGRGMCRLRAWYLHGCMGVGDRSMRSFARWPGLSVLDVRDTSCTEAALGILNRTGTSLFGGLQPPFQSCTEGLKGLFTPSDESEDVLNKLCLTLLKPDLPTGAGRRYLALHLVHADEPPRDEWLHAPLVSQRASRMLGGKEASRFVSGGVGQLYGSGVERIVDEEHAKRKKLALALEFEAEEAHALKCMSAGVAPPERRMDREWRERREMWAQEAADKKSGAYQWSSEYSHPHIVGKAFKDPGGDANERSRAFFSTNARRLAREDEDGDDLVGGSVHLMMVRMAHPEWTRLAWAVGGVSNKPDDVIRVRKRNTADVADILSFTQDVKRAVGSSSQPQMVANAFSPWSSPSPTRLASSPERKPSRAEPTGTVSQKAKPSPFVRGEVAGPSSQSTKPTPFCRASSSASQRPTGRQAGHNPFRAAAPTTSRSGVRALDVKTEVDVDVKPGIKKETKSDPLARVKPGSNARPIATKKDPLAFVKPSPGGSKKENKGDPLAFVGSSAGAKRKWDARGEQSDDAQPKPKGLKMFFKPL